MGKRKMVKNKFIKLLRVLDIVDVSRSHLYDLVSKKEFPAPIKLGMRSTRWLESEVYGWIEERIAASRGALPTSGLEESAYIATVPNEE